MVQEVYADLYVLINFGMDLLCLMITSALLHLPARQMRVLLAAGTGGCYALLSLLLCPPGVVGFLTDILAAPLLCVIAFASKKDSVFRLFRMTCAYFLTSAILGGVMTALYSFLNRLQLPLDSLQGDGLSVWSFALLSAAAGLATLKGGKFFGFAAKKRFVQVEAGLFGTTISLRALLDSGNLLQDPLSGRSVIVADRCALQGAIPQRLFEANTQEKLTALLSDHELARRIRLIPIHTAAGEGLLPAVIPDFLTVSERRGKRATDHLIAISDLGAHARDFDAVMPDH